MNKPICRQASFRPVRDIAELLSAATASFVTLSEPATSLPNRPLLFPEWSNEEIRTAHSAVGEPASIGLGMIPQAIVSGPSVIRTDAEILLLPNIQPFYVNYYLSNGLVESASHDTGDRCKVNVGDVFVITNFNSSVYGHWLLEGLPKLLWMFELSRDTALFEQPRFLLSKTHRRGVIYDWIKLLFPSCEIITYDEDREYIVAERLFMPSLLFSGEYFFHPALNRLVDRVKAQFGAADDKGDALYITRQAQSAFRELENRTEIEDLASSMGLRLVSPETLALPEQVRLFGGARAICGEYGSALHNALFTKRRSITISLNWINSCQSRIAQLRDHDMAYIVPTTGKAVKFEHGAGKQTYAINPEHAGRAFETAIAYARVARGRRVGARIREALDNRERG